MDASHRCGWKGQHTKMITQMTKRKRLLEQGENQEKLAGIAAPGAARAEYQLEGLSAELFALLSSILVLHPQDRLRLLVPQARFGCLLRFQTSAYCLLRVRMLVSKTRKSNEIEKRKRRKLKKKTPKV